MDAILNEQLDERTARLRRQNVTRVQRCRARKKGGGCCFAFDLSGNDVAALIAVGVLAEAERGNPDAVKVAFGKRAIEGYRCWQASHRRK
jgi:hypothetical protein